MLVKTQAYETLAANIAQSSHQHFSVRCAGQYFLIRHMTRNSGAIVFSKTLAAKIVVIQNAPMPNTKLVKRATTHNAKLSSAQRSSQANCNSHAMPKRWLPGNARVSCTHAAKGVGKRILTPKGVRMACKHRADGRAHTACRQNSRIATRSINGYSLFGITKTST